MRAATTARDWPWRGIDPRDATSTSLDRESNMDSPMDTGSITGEDEKNPPSRSASPHSSPPLLLQPPSFFRASSSTVASGHVEEWEKDPRRER